MIPPARALEMLRLFAIGECFGDDSVVLGKLLMEAKRKGLEISKTDAKKLIKEARTAWRETSRNGSKGEPDLAARDDEITLTDTGNSTRLFNLHGERLHYIAKWDEWLCWDGLRWHRDDHAVLLAELAKDVGNEMRRQAAALYDRQAAKRLFSFGLESLSAHRIAAMIKLTRGIKGILLDHEALDRDAYLLGVRNGVIDLRIGTLRDADPVDLMTMQAPVPFDPRATAPRWQRAMIEWFPSEDVRKYVQRLAGAALVGAQEDHVFVIHVGGGRNGKGTFIRALQKTLGAYAVTPHLSLLVQQRFPEHDTIKADLFRARLAVASETQRRVKLDEASIKNLTGGDRIVARRMRENPWHFDPTHSLWLLTNHLPEIAGRDTGIWSRIRVVKWESTFAIDPDRKLDTVLAAEAPGILRWAVDGCLEWQKQGLKEPESVVRETLAYRIAEDVFGRFVGDCRITFEETLEIRVAALQAMLSEWATARGVHVDRKEFVAGLTGEKRVTQKVGKEMDADGKRRSVRVWVGMGIDDSEELEQENEEIRSRERRESREIG